MSIQNQITPVDASIHTEIGRLQELANSINEKQKVIDDHLVGALNFAIEVGALLIEAKDQVPHGQWAKWLTDHTQLGRKQASKYMKLSDNAKLLSNVPSTRHLTSIDGAISYIAAEKKRLEAPKSVKAKPSPTPAKAPENIPSKEGEECDLKTELAKEGRSMPRGTSKDKSEDKSEDISPDISNDTSEDEADDESSDDMSLSNKSQTKENLIIEGDYTEVESAPKDDVEEKPPTHISNACEKDIKTVRRCIDPNAKKPTSKRQLQLATAAFNRILDAVTDAHVKPS